MVEKNVGWFQVVVNNSSFLLVEVVDSTDQLKYDTLGLLLLQTPLLLYHTLELRS